MKTIIEYIKEFFIFIKNKRKLKKRLSGLKKKDPFIYK
tara:strand:+ start:1423 stop:1536 length:114 start_codon:yes stop_codon:yes gene_type:complete